MAGAARARPGRGEGRARRGGSSSATPGAQEEEEQPRPAPRAPAQRSAMAAEDVDGLAVSRPHYGCEYRGSGSSRGCRATPSPTCPCLPGPSAGRGGWAAAGMGGTAGSGLRECPAGAARPAGSPHEPRPAAPPARWAPCRAGARRSSTVLLSAGHECWEKAGAGQRRGAPRLCRRRLPRAGPAPRPRCPPGRGGPAFRLPADFGDHTRLAGRNAALSVPSLLVIGLLWRGWLRILAADAQARPCSDTASKMISGAGERGAAEGDVASGSGSALARNTPRDGAAPASLGNPCQFLATHCLLGSRISPYHLF